MSSSPGNQPETAGQAPLTSSSLIEMFGDGVTLQDLQSALQLPPGTDESTIYRLIMSMLDPPRRRKLRHVNTLDDAVDLIRKSSRILVLSGAGISTSAGIPDFRSRRGIYVQINAEHPDLDDPKNMFDIEYFRSNPRPFYQFAKALYPGQFEPTVGHRFIKCIEDHRKLLRNYTQNIDTLERTAGIRRVLECHGSFAEATCTGCGLLVPGDAIKNDIINQRIPICPQCKSSGQAQTSLCVMKPNIVFFGEPLDDRFHSYLGSDKTMVDLLIVIGSSLKVRPVALIPRSMPPEVPQILINKERLQQRFDVELYGNCDDIIQEICLRLGGDWTKVCEEGRVKLEERTGCPGLKPKQTESESNEESSTNLAGGGGSASGAMSTSETNKGADDDEWVDVEILDSGSDSSDSTGKDRAELDIPDSAYYYIKPNQYLFPGAELTKSQYEKLCRAE